MTAITYYVARIFVTGFFMGALYSFASPWVSLAVAAAIGFLVAVVWLIRDGK